MIFLIKIYSFLIFLCNIIDSSDRKNNGSTFTEEISVMNGEEDCQLNDIHNEHSKEGLEFVKSKKFRKMKAKILKKEIDRDLRVETCQKNQRCKRKLINNSDLQIYKIYTDNKSIKKTKKTHLENKSQNSTKSSVFSKPEYTSSSHNIISEPNRYNKILEVNDSHCVTEDLSKLHDSENNNPKNQEISNNHDLNCNLFEQKPCYSEIKRVTDNPNICCGDHIIIQTKSLNLLSQNDTCIEKMDCEFCKEVNKIISNPLKKRYFLSHLKSKIAFSDFPESFSIIKEELYDIIYPTNDSEAQGVDDFSGIQGNNKSICSETTNNIVKIYCNKFETRLDLNNILAMGKKIVRFEKYFYKGYNTTEIVANISEINYFEFLRTLKQTQIHLIFIELNYIYDICRDYNVNPIKKGCVLYVHYIFGVLEQLTDFILENKKSILENNSKNEKIIDKIFMSKLSFFTRKLISELLVCFNFNPEKIKIYRILNILHYFSVVNKKVNSFVTRKFFTMITRFCFRFLFDAKCKVDDFLIKKLIIGILCYFESENSCMALQRGISSLFYKRFCLYFFYKRSIDILNEKEFQICINNVIMNKSMIIDRIKDKLKKISSLEENKTKNIEIFKFFIEIELIMSYLDRKMIPKSVEFLEIYYRKSYDFVFNDTMEQIEKFYEA